MKTKEEIEELKHCLKDKNRRIKKLEKYFWLRNNIILSILGMLLVWSPLIILFLFGKQPPADRVHYLVVDVFSILGTIFFIILEILGTFFVLQKIWERE